MSLEQDIVRLARTRPFDLLPRDALKLIAFSAERKTFPAGRILFEQGDEADGAYFILSGAVALIVHGKAESEQRIVGPGALVGEMAMFAPIARPVSARAQEDTIALRISRDLMTRVLGEYPRETASIRAALAERTRRITAELEAVRRRAQF
jgi:CRP-like cAMP-binding protein